MAKWQRTLKLADIWPDDKHESVQEVAKIVAERLRALKPFPDESLNSERDEIADEFEALAEDENADNPDFNLVMDRLYDWADSSLDSQWNGAKVCWVETF